MSDLDQAVETQIKNIQTKTGKSFDELAAIVRQSGLTKHAEIRAMLQRDLGLGYGDANALVHAVLQSDGARAAAASGMTTDAVLADIYSGPKAALRPIHEALMSRINGLGDFETLPKKGYVSLRRKKQFAMIGPPTNTRVDVGINAKALEAHPRLLMQPAGSMCNYIVRVTDPQDVDEELFAWIRTAFESAG